MKPSLRTTKDAVLSALNEREWMPAMTLRHEVEMALGETFHERMFSRALEVLENQHVVFRWQERDSLTLLSPTRRGWAVARYDAMRHGTLSAVRADMGEVVQPTGGKRVPLEAVGSHKATKMEETVKLMGAEAAAVGLRLEYVYTAKQGNLLFELHDGDRVVLREPLTHSIRACLKGARWAKGLIRWQQKDTTDDE